MHHRKNSSSTFAFAVPFGNTENADTHLNDKSNSQDEIDMKMFHVIQTFPKKLLDPNQLFEKIIFKKKIALNSLDQEEIDHCRDFVRLQREKYKHLQGKLRVNTSVDIHSEESGIPADLLNEENSKDVYGFKKDLNALSWNQSIKGKMRQIRGLKQ